MSDKEEEKGGHTDAIYHDLEAESVRQWAASGLQFIQWYLRNVPAPTPEQEQETISLLNQWLIMVLIADEWTGENRFTGGFQWPPEGFDWPDYPSVDNEATREER